MQAVDSLGLNTRYFVKGKFRDYELYNESPFFIEFDSAGYQGNNTELVITYKSDGHFNLKENGANTNIISDTWITRPWGTFKLVYANTNGKPNPYLLQKIYVRVTTVPQMARFVYTNYRVSAAEGSSNVIDLQYKDNISQRGIDFLDAIINIYYNDKLKNIDQSAQKTRDFINQHKADLMNNLQAIDSTVDKIKAGAGMVDVQTQTSTIVSQKMMWIKI